MSTAADKFTKVPNALLRDSALDIHCRLLAACLLSYAWESDTCKPSQKTLAREIGCSERAVRIHQQHLEGVGLRVTREAYKGAARNVYHVGKLQRYVPAPNRNVDSGSGVANRNVGSAPNRNVGSAAEPEATFRLIRHTDKNTQEEKTQRSRSGSSNHDRHPRTHAPRATRESLGIAPPGADWLWAYNRLSDVGFETPDDNVMRSWLQTYGDQRFIRAVELLTVRKSDPKAKPIDAPLQWIEAAMKADFKPNARDVRFATALACTTA